MATVFRRGGRRSGGVYLVRWLDENGVRRQQSSRTRDKRVAEQIADEIERHVALARAGLRDPRLERFAAEDRRPIAEHVEDFARYLHAKGNTAQHVEGTRRDVVRVLGLARVERLSDLAPSKVQEALAALRPARAGDEPLSLRTLNKALRATKSFSRWLVRDGRAPSDPLTALEGFNAATDVRRRRRDFTPEELDALIRTAEAGPRRYGLSGPDRAMLYRLAAGTGFRAGELGSLTPESFRLGGDPPLVVVSAAYSKRRREDEQPISHALAELLRPWLARRPAGLHVFDVARLSEATGRMIREDFEAAGIQARDASGDVLDFHGLRHSYVSTLVRSGASVKEAQELARHSTPTLTFGRYAHVRRHDLARVVERLDPPTFASTAAALRATGTGDAGQPENASGGCHQKRHHAGDRSAPDAAGPRRSEESDAEKGDVPKVACNDALRRSAPVIAGSGDGGPGRIRTCDRWIMSPLL